MVPVKGVILKRRTKAEMEVLNEDGSVEVHKRFDILLDLPDGNMIVKEYDTPEIECYDCFVDPDLAALGNAVIDARMELSHIDAFIGRERICYVTSYEPKKKRGSAKMVLAECRAVRDSFRALTDFRYIITFYDPNIGHLDDDQKVILMLHELRHIKHDGRVEEHDTEDFSGILTEFGINWADPGAKVPRILGG